MTKNHDRQTERMAINRVELVTVFRDEQDRSYSSLAAHRGELDSLHTVFSVVALVRDVSQDGLGIKFEGQRLMAANLLKPNENYVIKLTLVLDEVPSAMTGTIKREGNYFTLLLKVTCRWHETKERISTAGFAVRPSNPPAVLEFLREHFGLGY